MLEKDATNKMVRNNIKRRSMGTNKTKPIEIQIETRKWRWIGHTLRKTEGAVEKEALDWNPQGARRRGRPRITWKRSIEKEIRRDNKTWREVKAIATQRERWKSFTHMPYVPKGMTGIKSVR